MSIIDDYLADKSKLEKELEDCRHANGIGTGRELSEAEQTAWMRADTECSVRREELRRKYFPGSTAWSEPRTELDIPDIAKPADLWYIVHEELLPGFPNALRFARTRDFSARLNRALQQVCSV